MILKRATLHILDTGPMHDPKRGHLFVVVTNVCSDNKHLLIPVCSQHTRCDRTCLLGAGDHSFISRDSYMDYGRARVEETTKLSQLMNTGHIQSKGPIDETVFSYMTKGILESRYTSPIIKAYYLKQSS